MLKAMTIAAVGLIGAAPPAALPNPVHVESGVFRSRTLGLVHVYAPARPATRMAVVLSGDGGWKLDEAGARVAAALAARGVLALGVDANQVTALMAREGGGGFDLGGALTSVAREASGREAAKGPVVLSGYSSGATLAYATFAQSPPGRFSGLITMGFCPDLETGRPVGGPDGSTMGYKRLLVRGWVYKAQPLPGPWAAIEGGRERACPGGDVKAFVGAVPHARLWTVKDMSHGFGPPSLWTGALSQALSWAGVAS